MEYRKDVDLSGSKVRYGSGGGRRRGGLVVGGAGGVIVLLVAVFLGVDLTDLLGGQQPAPPTEQPTQSAAACDSSSDIEDNRECRWQAYDVALEGYWSSALAQGFEPPSAVELFSGSVATACGTGSSEMGPFYCPGDTTIYLDTEFMGQLLTQLGTQRSDAAELYIVGHEYGHHISTLTGQMAKARADGDDTGPASSQVRLELQADCYAGAFFANTVKDPRSPVAAVTEDDLRRIVDAARAVGDDHIQQQSGGSVVPESWTHGSSAMRQHWVSIGFSSGDPAKCDTFATDDLGG